MASREEELKELAELEELAQLEALAAQETAPKPTQDLNLAEQALQAAMPVLDPLGRVIDVATLGAPIRAGVAKLVEAQTGKEIAPELKLSRGQAPTFKEIWESQGIKEGTPISEVLPGMFSPTGEELLKFKKGGMFDITPLGAAGGVMDIATGMGGSAVKALKETALAQKALSKIPSVPKYSIMSALSGVPREAIETYSKNREIINQLDPIKAAELAEQATIDARKAVTGMRQQLGQTLQRTMEEAGNKAADISSFKDKLYKNVSKSVGDLKNISNQELAASLKAQLDELFQKTVTTPKGLTLSPEGILQETAEKVTTVPISNKLKATELFDLRNQLKDLGDLYGGKPGIVSKQSAAKIPVADKRLQTSLLDAVKQLDSMIDNTTAGASKEARAAYAEQASKARAIDSYFSTPERTVSTLSNLSSRAKGPSRKALQEADQLFGTNLEETGKVLESAKYFNEPSIEALSGKGSTSTSRTYGGAAVGAAVGSALGGPGGAALGTAIGAKAASPAAIRYVYLPSGEILDKVTGAVSRAGQSNLVRPVTEQASKIPSQVWLEMLRSKQGEQK